MPSCEIGKLLYVVHVIYDYSRIFMVMTFHHMKNKYAVFLNFNEIIKIFPGLKINCNLDGSLRRPI